MSSLWLTPPLVKVACAVAQAVPSPCVALPAGRLQISWPAVENNAELGSSEDADMAIASFKSSTKRCVACAADHDHHGIACSAARMRMRILESLGTYTGAQ